MDQSNDQGLKRTESDFGGGAGADPIETQRVVACCSLAAAAGPSGSIADAEDELRRSLRSLYVEPLGYLLTLVLEVVA